MARIQKLLKKVLAGTGNVRFADVVALAECCGFKLARVTGSHHIFNHPQLVELLNLQENRGKAKPYQIRQLLALLEDYDLLPGDDK